MPIYKHKETGQKVEVVKGTILPKVYELVKKPETKQTKPAAVKQAKPAEATKSKSSKKAAKKPEEATKTAKAEK